MSARNLGRATKLPVLVLMLIRSSWSSGRKQADILIRSFPVSCFVFLPTLSALLSAEM